MASHSDSQQGDPSIDNRWIVRLNPEATLQAGSVRGAACY